MGENIVSCDSPNAVFVVVLKSKWLSAEAHTKAGEAIVIVMSFIIKTTTSYQEKQTARQQDTPAVTHPFHIQPGNMNRTRSFS